MTAFLVDNHQNNCEITRVTSVLYRPLKTKKLGQNICTKQILPLRVQTLLQHFHNFLLWVDQKELLLMPLPNQDKISKFK